MVRKIFAVWCICNLALSLTACSGLGVRAEMYRIDETQSSERTYNKPLKCLFVDCGPMYSREEVHGS